MWAVIINISFVPLIRCLRRSYRTLIRDVKIVGKYRRAGTVFNRRWVILT